MQTRQNQRSSAAAAGLFRHLRLALDEAEKLLTEVLVRQGPALEVPTPARETPHMDVVGVAQEKRLFTIKDVCLATRLGRSTIYKAINEGDLHKVKAGSRTLIKAEDLQAWMNTWLTP